MDRHQELYKVNQSVLSPRQQQRTNRELQQRNRAKSRKDMYMNSRNIVVSPTPVKNLMMQSFETGVRISSTPMVFPSDVQNKENQGKPLPVPLHTSRIAIAATADPEKRSRQGVYLSRFIEWKEKKKMQEQQRKEVKRPFIPAGKNVRMGGSTAAPSANAAHCVLPKSSTFKAPAGLIDPTKPQQETNSTKKHQRQSLYAVVPTPPRKTAASNITEKKKPTTTQAAPLLRRALLQSAPRAKQHVALSVERPHTQSAKAPPPPPNLTDKMTPANAGKPSLKSSSKVFLKPRQLKLPMPTESKSLPVKNSTLVKVVKRTTATTAAKTTKTTTTSKMLTAKTTTTTTASNIKPKMTTTTASNITAPPKPLPKPTGGARIVKPLISGQLANTKTIRSGPPQIQANGGAAAKARQLLERKQPLEPATKKAKLTVNMKAKKPVNRNAAGRTTLKHTALLQVQEAIIAEQAVEEKEKVLETPSEHQTDQKDMEGDRQQQARKSKYNFVRYSEVPTAIDDTILALGLEDSGSDVRKSAADVEEHEKCSKISSDVTTEDQQTEVAQQQQPRRSKYNFVRYSEAPTTNDDTIIALGLQGENMENASAANNNTIVAENAAPTELNLTPKTCAERPSNYMSPFVTVSRGKVSLKAEKERRDSVYLQNTDSPAKSPTKVTSSTLPEAAPQTPVEVRRALETVRYFRKQLADEIARLHSLCEQWEMYKNDNLQMLQETGGEDMINVTIGQTKLLTSKKFMQFNGLIERCESTATGVNALVDDGSEKTKPITPIDLEGFWSMISLQVDNVDKRFENLESWKRNNWLDPAAADVVEPKPKTANNLTKVKKAKAVAKKPAPRPKASSALQEMMRKMHADMRKKKAAAEQAMESNLVMSPRMTRRRLSQLVGGRTPQDCRIIVPDRKSMSMAATIINVPSPRHSGSGRKLSQDSPRHSSGSGRKFSQDSPKLRPHLLELDRSLTHLRRESGGGNELLKAALMGASHNAPTPPHLQKPRKKSSSLSGTPSTVKSTSPLRNACPKSILKTPGTAKSGRKSVIFNSKRQVRKFKFTIEDPPSDGEQDESEPVRTPPQKSESEEEDDADKRTYRLRGRKVVLRPSSEFEIPR